MNNVRKNNSFNYKSRRDSLYWLISGAFGRDNDHDGHVVFWVVKVGWDPGAKVTLC